MHYSLSCPKGSQNGNQNFGKENGLSASQNLCVIVPGCLFYIHIHARLGNPRVLLPQYSECPVPFSGSNKIFFKRIGRK